LKEIRQKASWEMEQQ